MDMYRDDGCIHSYIHTCIYDGVSMWTEREKGRFRLLTQLFSASLEHFCQVAAREAKARRGIIKRKLRKGKKKEIFFFKWTKV